MNNKMKRGILICLAVMTLSVVYGQKSVAADSLKFYEGNVIRVCENVSDTFVTKGEKKTTFLSFGYGYPNQLFTAVIFEEDLKNFKYVPAEFLKGKNVCLIGDVRMYNGLAEIIIEREDQITVQ